MILSMTDHLVSEVDVVRDIAHGAASVLAEHGVPNDQQGRRFGAIALLLAATVMIDDDTEADLHVHFLEYVRASLTDDKESMERITKLLLGDSATYQTVLYVNFKAGAEEERRVE